MNEPTNTPEPPSADLLTKAVNQERKINEMYRERDELRAEVERLKHSYQERTFEIRAELAKLREENERMREAARQQMESAQNWMAQATKLRAENAELAEALAKLVRLYEAPLDFGEKTAAECRPPWLRSALAKYAATPTLANHDKTE